MQKNLVVNQNFQYLFMEFEESEHAWMALITTLQQTDKNLVTLTNNNSITAIENISWLRCFD